MRANERDKNVNFSERNLNKGNGNQEETEQ